MIPKNNSQRKIQLKALGLLRIHHINQLQIKLEALSALQHHYISNLPRSTHNPYAIKLHAQPGAERGHVNSTSNQLKNCQKTSEYKDCMDRLANKTIRHLKQT